VDPAPREGDVFLFHLAVLELACQLAVREVVLRHDHEPGRASVEAMHDSRALFTADAAEVVGVEEQRVDERPFAVTGGRVDDHPGGLVHHQDVGVLEEDRERQFFGLGCRRRGLGHLDDDLLAGLDGLVRPGAGAAHRDEAFADQALELRPRVLRKEAGKVDVEPLPRALRVHHELVAIPRATFGRHGTTDRLAKEHVVPSHPGHLEK